MDHVGIDLGKRESQIAILTEDGELINRRIRTERPRLAEMFGRRPQARILLEASTESEWVARCLEDLGHEVIVADPNYAPMYARRTRRVKTDRRDAHALAHACRAGTYRPAHRTSTERRALRARLAVREAVVRTRAAWITRIQSLVRREGCRLRTGAPETFLTRVEELALPPALMTVIAPLVDLLGPLNATVAALDEELERIVAADEVLRRCSRTSPPSECDSRSGYHSEHNRDAPRAAVSSSSTATSIACRTAAWISSPTLMRPSLHPDMLCHGAFLRAPG